MNKNRCLVCGSLEFRADRALSGRLVCTSCGKPYGVRKVSGNKYINNVSFFNNKKLFFIGLVILVFLIVII